MTSPDNSSPGNAVKSDAVPKVASSSKASRYFIYIVLVALVVLFVRTLFSDSYKTKQTTEVIRPAADNTNNAPQLDLTPAEIQPPKPIIKPPEAAKFIPPAPSVLPPPPAADTISQQALETRLKSPTMVYDASKDAAANTSQTNATLGSDPNNGFMQQAANAQVITVSAKRNSNTDYKILQGKLITAVLETAIDSDLPGMVRGVISKDVYSDTGRVILLPRGTRLIGQYNSSLAVGQTRVMIVWTRAITPQYVDIALGSPNSDPLGQSGMDGDVNNHFWKIFGTSALLSVLGVAASAPTTASSDSINGNIYQNSVSQGVLNTSATLLQSRINIQPTIRVPQGSAVQVFVARDLDFSNIPYYKNQ